MAAKGDVGEDNSAGGVIGINGNPHTDTARSALVAQPVGVGCYVGADVEALKQVGCGLGRERNSGVADYQAVRRVGQ